MKSRLTLAKSNLTAPQFISDDVAADTNIAPPDYAIHRDKFPFYSIENVMRGSGEVHLKGRRFSLQLGSMFFYGHSHRVHGSRTETLVKYFLDFTGTLAKALLHSCDLLLGKVAKVFPANVLCSLLDETIMAGLQVRPIARCYAPNCWNV